MANQRDTEDIKVIIENPLSLCFEKRLDKES